MMDRHHQIFFLVNTMQENKSLLTILSILGFVAAVVGNMTATLAGRKYYEEHQHGGIFDVGYLVVPQIHIPKYIFILTELAWIPFIFHVPNKMLGQILFAIMLRLSAIMSLRAIANSVTILPKDGACDSYEKWSLRNFLTGACYDKLFSGHMAYVSLVSLAFVSCGVWNPWMGWAYSGLMALLMLLSRGHYTVDLVIGAALAYLSWTSSIFPKCSV